MRILIVDDHRVVRQGLRRLLAPEGEHAVTEAADGQEALRLAHEVRPHVIILDLNLPGLGGLELLRRLVVGGWGRVLVLTMHAETQVARRAMNAGAYGFLSKNVAPEELVTAVQRVGQGGRYVEAEIAQALALEEEDDGELGALSVRELEVLRLLADGSKLQDIAAQLGVTYKTVANTCARIKSKLGVSRTIDLLRIALDTRQGLGGA
ncbi:MAG TPA: response regulator transcription factor [Caulobacteraceae bacterium]|nr:response regulator transcription factor [Caulobacteraceae bacterium]